MNRDDALGTRDASDPDLPMLTAIQAARLRALAASHIEDGHHSPLHNLAHICRRVPEDRWPDLVESHFANLRQASRSGESAAELLAGVHARLLPVESFTADLAGSLSYARLVADGLVFTYALDGPTTVRILTDVDVNRAGLEKLGQAAYANLMGVPVEHEEVAIDGRALLHSAYGDSPFVESKALFLSELARQVTGEPLPKAGALVVVPTRHLLAYHPIVDGSVADAINDLAAYALGAYEDGPGALSPRVYWWHQGGLQSLTVIDHATRTFSLQPPPDLLGLMKGLVRLDQAGRLASRATAKAPGGAAGRRERPVVGPEAGALHGRHGPAPPFRPHRPWRHRAHHHGHGSASTFLRLLLLATDVHPTVFDLSRLLPDTPLTASR
ncbi:hypothetical protein [Streptomyces sp. NPDC059649]|uniref:hypothetical protein n=1 Tax=Streptomyces sp. NPDC059649 TaxID=3346895 RepID=UPI0036784BBF